MDAPVINTSDAVCIPQKQSNVSRSHRAKLNKPEEPDVDNLCQGDTKSLFTLCEDEAETKDISFDISKKKKPHTIGTIFRLFRFATPLDWFLMVIGAVAAVGGGLAAPLSMLLFGDFVNIFTFNALTNNVSLLLFNATVGCDNFLLSSTIHNFSTSENAINCVDNDMLISAIDVTVYKTIGIAVGMFVASYIQVITFQTACERQLYKIRLYYYRAILRQDIGWFDGNPSGELASRLSDDLDKIHDGIGDKLSILIQFLATFFGGVVIAFVRSWKVSLMLLAFLPILTLSASIFAKVNTSLTTRAQKLYASAGAVAEEVLSSIRTVVSLGREQAESERYNYHLKEAGQIGVKKGLGSGMVLAFIFFTINSLYAVVFWFGAYLISVGQINSGGLLTAFFALLTGAFALSQVSPNVENLLTAVGASVTIYDTIDRVPPIDSTSVQGLVPENFDSTVEFKDVQFRYPTRPDVQILKGFNLKVLAGKTVALVGPSGCGKSTLIQLLQRFYDCNAGEVCVGGENIHSLNLNWLRRQIGLVSQEPVLFHTTIAENIRYGREDATQDDIEKAAREANAHDFIISLPNGYNTEVGERGVQLSGGQKQRVAIARALVRNPKLLLLDEATSALDAESESVVQEALEKARTGRTSLVIAHRLSTIQNADLIVAIKNGQVVEMGTHEELIQRKGLYFNLVAAQTCGDPDDISLLPSKPGYIRSASRPTSSPTLGTKLHKNTSRTDEETAQPALVLRHQLSHSDMPIKLERMTSKALQDQWDKEIPVAPLIKLVKKNAPEWWMIALGLIGSGVGGAIAPLFSIFFGRILGVFANPPDKVFPLVHPWAGLFLAFAVVISVATLLKVVCFSVAGERLTLRLRSETFHAILKQDISWFDDQRNSTGALVTRLANDAAQVDGATGARLGTLFETAFGLLVALIIAFVYSWILTIVVLCFAPLMMVAGLLQAKVVSGHVVGYKKALENAGKLAVDSIQNIRTVTSLSIQGVFANMYATESRKPYIKALWSAAMYSFTYGFSQGIFFFGYVITFRFGAFLVTLPRDHFLYTSFNNLFVVIQALIFGATTAGQAGAFAPNYAKARLSANRIFALLERSPETSVYCSEEGAVPDNVSGEVTLENVIFHYSSRPDVHVLNGLSIALNSGQTLALVGSSGCGKSTVVSLLERFYEPQSGCLRLDKQDIRDLNIRWLRQNIGIVSQEPVLFDTSIANNIRYGATFREVSDEEVIVAAKAANIHSFIETLPEGYNTNVGAKGTQMSGGQKQRIAIARALVRNPKILLLDEATSALDTESEKVVQEALDKAREGRTSIVIAHRLSTIHNADFIAVLKSGRVAESGNHGELMKMRGLYYKLNSFHHLVDGQPDQ